MNQAIDVKKLLFWCSGLFSTLRSYPSKLRPKKLDFRVGIALSKESQFDVRLFKPREGQITWQQRSLLLLHLVPQI